MRAVGAQSQAPAPQLATRPQWGQPGHCFLLLLLFPRCFVIAPVCPSPCQPTRSSSACAASGARGLKGWAGSRRPWGHKYKQGKNSNPTNLRHSSAALSCPVLGFPRQPDPHGSRSSTFLQLHSVRRDISHNNLLEVPAGTTLPGSETSKHPQLPTLSRSRLRKA